MGSFPTGLGPFPFLEPKGTQMRTKQITLPNGFMSPNGELVRRMEIRKLGGREEDLLVDKDELKKGTVLFQILKNCTVSMGAIDDPKQISALYDSSFLLADLSYVLVELRAWGIDPQYTFEHQCPTCETIGKHVIDLSSLRVEEQKPEYRGKDRYIATLNDAPKPLDKEGNALAEKEWSYGTVPITFRPLYVRDQKLLEAIKSDHPKQKATRELYIQLVEYDGHEIDKLDIKTFQSFDSGTRGQIRTAIEAASGGVNTELLMSCRKCTRTYKDSLPVDIKHFFFRVGDGQETRTATPFLDVGMTLTSWPSGLGGSPQKSPPSASKSAAST